MEVILRVTSGPHADQEFVFDRHDTFVVGRSSQVQFSVHDDRRLSREHFLIEINPPLCFLKDLGSTNGTKVNGLRVESAQLRDGDVIAAGESTFIVLVEETASRPAAHIRCLGCGQPAPEETSVAAAPEDSKIDWLCDACAAHRLQYPTTSPDYWIERRIGGGGMGEVYHGRQLATNRPVAIKMMVPTVAASERAKEYFRREIEVLQNLLMPTGNATRTSSPSTTSSRSTASSSSIMEYVAGKNALEWVAAMSGPLPFAAAARIGVQLLSALEHAHKKGYVHRDIKPSNLLIMGPPQRPHVKLSDFGLAKSFRDNAGFAGLTHLGDIGGSIGFISPDHIRDFRDVKEPADIYSVGATLYYLLTLHYPFLGFDPNRGDAYSMILEHPPVPLRAHRPDAPEGLERVLRKALEKQPRDRWTSAAAMAKALRPFADERA